MLVVIDAFIDILFFYHYFSILVEVDEFEYLVADEKTSWST
jgi:hypothetical protein